MLGDNRIGQLLLKEGVLTEDQLKKALELQQNSYAKLLGEILLEQKFLDESTFLRILAKQFHTQYLTTKKLSDLSVADSVIKLVPESVAEKHQLFPVQYKKSEKALTIVMVSPDNVGAIDDVKFVSGVGNVKTLIGLPESIKAAIAKWYKNDLTAFNSLLGIEFNGGGYDSSSGAPAPADAIEQNDSALDIKGLIESNETREDQPAATPKPAAPKPDAPISIGVDKDEDVYLGGPTELPGDYNMARDSIVIENISGDDGAGYDEIEVMATPRASARPQAPAPEPDETKPARRGDVKKYRMRMLVVESHDSIRKFIAKLFGHEGFRVRSVTSKQEAIDELAANEYDTLVIKNRDMGEGDDLEKLMADRFPAVELCSIKDYGSAIIGETRAQSRLMASFLETLDVLMGLLEMEGAGMQGHAYNMGKYSRLIASRLDLPQREVDTIALTAYLHDLGKKGMAHRTVLTIDKTTDPDELMEQALLPLKLLSAAKFPLQIAPIIKNQYEKWDGAGLPAGVKGEEIPIGARILALVEAFEDLTNKYSGHKAIEHAAALELIKKNQGAAFDPQLVDILLALIRDDIYLQQMAGDKERILIVDGEADQVTLLELRLANLGFAVNSARLGKIAVEKAKTEKPALIILDVDLPDLSGFDVIEQVLKSGEIEPAFLFFTKKDDPELVNRGFGMGAEDYIIKPMKVEILGAKVQGLMKKLRSKRKNAPTASGVSGQLSEMGVPDIIQILGAGRKTGRISLLDGDVTAIIDMDEGQVVNAKIHDLKGEEAFYKILYLTKGSFSIDPNAQITERVINMNNDSLMLEGFRLMDEATQGKPEAEDIAMDGSDFF